MCRRAFLAPVLEVYLIGMIALSVLGGLHAEEADRVAEDCWQAPTPSCIFDLALATAHGIQNAYGRNHALGQIAEGQATIGQVGAAMSTASLIDHPRDRASTIAGVAKAAAMTGQYEQALTTARGIGDSDFRAFALGEIVSALAEEGRFEKALATAREIERGSDRDRALATLAKAQAEAGDYEAAMFAQGGIESHALFAVTMGEIVAAMANAGEVDAARIMANALRDPFFRAAALRRIAQTLAALGRFEEAFAVADSIEGSTAHRRAVRELAAIQSKASQSGSAPEDITDDTSIAKSPSQVVATYVEAGEYDAALSAARHIQGAEQHVLALNAIAEAQSKSGHTHAARETLGMAVEAAYRVAGEMGRVWALCEIALAFPSAAGEPANADSDSEGSQTAIVGQNASQSNSVWFWVFGLLAAGVVYFWYRARAHATNRNER